MRFLRAIFPKKPIYEFDEKSNGWIAYYGDVKGFCGQGYTKEEALKSLERDIKEAKELDSKAEKSVSKEFRTKARMAPSH